MKYQSRYLTAIISGLALLLSAGAALAAPPQSLYFQGYLTDPGGIPVNGNWPMTFGFFTQPSGGEPLWEDMLDVETESGVFSVVLGASGDNPVEPILFESGTVYLGITIWGADGPEELLPRQKVISNPYAFYSHNAQTCGQADTALSLEGTAAAEFVTQEQIPELCMPPTDLQDWLDEHGFAAGLHYSDADTAAFLAGNDYHPGVHYSDDDAAAFLDANDYHSGPHYTDAETAGYLEANDYHAGVHYADIDVTVYLDENGYVPGPHFSGSYLDLADVPQDLVFQGWLTEMLLQYYDAATVDELLTGKADAGHQHDETYVNAGEQGSISADMLQEGAVTFDSLAAGGCENGEVIKQNDGAWNCGEDENTDTVYLPGDGIAIEEQTVSLAIQPCLPGQAIKRNLAGTGWVCAPDIDTDTDTDTTYSGVDFALSNQNCGPGLAAVGINAGGTLACAPDANTEYSGEDFALSGQACGPGEHVTALGGDGAISCGTDKNTEYDGADFATSNQACSGTDKVKGIAADGSVQCAKDLAGFSTVCSDIYTSVHGRVAMFRYNPSTRKIYLRMNNNAHLNGVSDIGSYGGWTEVGAAPGSETILSLDCSLAMYNADAQYHLSVHLEDAAGKSWFKQIWTSSVPPAASEWWDWLDMGSPW